MTQFAQEWDKLLSQPTATGSDVVFSITEDTINSYLQAHFANDTDKYTFSISQHFQTYTGPVRTFEISLTARAPLEVELPPLSGKKAPPANRGKIPLPSKPREPALHAPAEGSKDPNIRVRLSRLALSLSWDKLDGSGKWTWTPSEISADAECYVALSTRSSLAPNEDPGTTAHYLSLTPISIVFDKTDRHQISAQFQKFIDTLKPADQALVLSEAVDKFDDLLVIALNVVATRAGPQMVTNVQIPSPVVLNRHVVPSAILLSDKMISVALGFNSAANSARNRLIVDDALTRLEHAFSDDVAEHGGLSKLAIRPGDWEGRSPKEVEVLSVAEIMEKLKRTQKVLESIQAMGSTKIDQLGMELAGARVNHTPVQAGIGIAVDEALLTSLAQDALPSPQSRCSDWLPILDVVRGRACYWARVFDAQIHIAGTTVSGSVGVNAGGDLEACIRKFWDCSWSWDCGSLALGIAGYPGISVSLKSGAGLAFSAQLTGGVSLETNLPYPFNKVVEAVSASIVSFIIAIVNLFIANITIVIVPPALTIPKQRTKLVLTRFEPFSYMRPGGNEPKNRFIAFSINTDTGT